MARATAPTIDEIAGRTRLLAVAGEGVAERLRKAGATVEMEAGLVTALAGELEELSFGLDELPR